MGYVRIFFLLLSWSLLYGVLCFDEFILVVWGCFLVRLFCGLLLLVVVV